MSPGARPNDPTRRALTHGTATLLRGAAGAQLLLLGTTPALSRLYPAEAFGAFALLVASIVLAQPLVTGALERAIPLATGADDAARLAAACLRRTGIACALSVPVLGVATWSGHWGSPGVAWAWPALMAAFATWLVLGSMAQLRRVYEVQSSARLVQAATLCIVQLAAFPLGAAGLAAGFAAGYCAGIARLVRGPADSRSASRDGDGVQSASLRALARRAVDGRNRTGAATGTDVGSDDGAGFRRRLAPSLVLNVAGREAVPLLLAVHYDAFVVGLYYLAARVVSAPLALVVETYSRIIYRESRDRLDDGTLGAFLAAIVAHLVRLGLPLAAIVPAAAPAGFAWLFGASWHGAGEVAARLVPWALTAAVTVPLLGTWSVLRRQEVGLRFEIGSLAARCAALLIGPYFTDFLGTMTLYAAVATTSLLAQAWWLLRLTGGLVHLNATRLRADLALTGGVAAAATGASLTLTPPALLGFAAALGAALAWRAARHFRSGPVTP